MRRFLGRTLPLLIVLVFGILGAIQYFVPHRISQVFYKTVLAWSIGVASMAVITAAISFLRYHYKRIMTTGSRSQDVLYSSVALVAFIAMLGFGIFGTGKGSIFYQIYQNVFVPINSTIFSLLAFYMASASYRAFRAKTFESALLLIAAIIVILGTTSLGSALMLDKFTIWVMNVPNLAQKRGILIGIGLGATATSLKIILGIEKNWLGG